jgi:5-methylcytosine-specific restriction endonuclease McrA
MPQCKKCGNELHGNQISYCSQRCSKLHLKALYRKRKRSRINEYNRKWKSAHPEHVQRWRITSLVKAGKDPFAPKKTKASRERIVYMIPCVACPEGKFLSQRRRKYCPTHNPRTPHKLRFQILERDGFKCRYCGRGAPEVVLHVDHRKSRKDGGADEFENLVTACFRCNIGKGAHSLDIPQSPASMAA